MSNHGVISDAAMISSFSTFAARLAVKEALEEVITSDIPSSILTTLLTMAFGPPQEQATQLALSQFLSFDFIISSLISLCTIISIPYLLVYDDEDVFFRRPKNPFTVDKETSGKERLKRVLLYSLSVILYMYMVLNVTGNITNNAVLFRVIQSFLVLGGYLFYMYITRKMDVD